MPNAGIETPWRPTPQQLQAARARKVPDVISNNLRVLFVGINPGLYSAAIGHHFGRPGNRFWPAVHAGGFTPTIFSPFEEIRLLDYHLGITNLVERATAGAAELTREELITGARRLRRKILRYRPAFAALLGLTSFRIAFEHPRAILGLQPERVGSTRIWLLPNPSGLNAHHQPRHLAKMFHEFYLASLNTRGRETA